MYSAAPARIAMPPWTAKYQVEPTTLSPRTSWKMAATQSPAVTARNHTPIIWLAYLAGASLVVTDRPTGERVSSPTVWIR